MTPFIIWLNKEDLDNLVTILVKFDNSMNKNNEAFSGDELVGFTQSLMQQNEELLEILKKIELKEPSNDIIIEQIRTDHKCSVYQNYLKQILVHCTSQNNNFKHTTNSKDLLDCNDCSFKEDKIK